MANMHWLVQWPIFIEFKLFTVVNILTKAWALNTVFDNSNKIGVVFKNKVDEQESFTLYIYSLPTVPERIAQHI